MKTIDMRFDSNIFKQMIGQTFKKYRSDEFVFNNSVTGIIGIFVDETAYSLRGNDTDQIVVVTLIPVGREVDPVFEQTEVDADDACYETGGVYVDVEALRRIPDDESDGFLCTDVSAVLSFFGS